MSLSPSPSRHPGPHPAPHPHPHPPPGELLGVATQLKPEQRDARHILCQVISLDLPRSPTRHLLCQVMISPYLPTGDEAGGRVEEAQHGARRPDALQAAQPHAPLSAPLRVPLLPSRSAGGGGLIYVSREMSLSTSRGRGVALQLCKNWSNKQYVPSDGRSLVACRESAATGDRDLHSPPVVGLSVKNMAGGEVLCYLYRVSGWLLHFYLGDKSVRPVSTARPKIRSAARHPLHRAPSPPRLSPRPNHSPTSRTQCFPFSGIFPGF